MLVYNSSLYFGLALSVRLIHDHLVEFPELFASEIYYNLVRQLNPRPAKTRSNAVLP
jgi:hypothetical protein